MAPYHCLHTLRLHLSNILDQWLEGGLGAIIVADLDSRPHPRTTVSLGLCTGIPQGCTLPTHHIGHFFAEDRVATQKSKVDYLQCRNILLLCTGSLAGMAWTIRPRNKLCALVQLRPSWFQSLELLASDHLDLHCAQNYQQSGLARLLRKRETHGYSHPSPGNPLLYRLSRMYICDGSKRPRKARYRNGSKGVQVLDGGSLFLGPLSGDGHLLARPADLHEYAILRASLRFSIEVPSRVPGISQGDRVNLR